MTHQAPTITLEATASLTTAVFFFFFLLLAFIAHFTVLQYVLTSCPFFFFSFFLFLSALLSLMFD